MVKILARNERLEIFSENKVLGYVEDNKLFGFDRDGYAVEICDINDSHEIITKYQGWKKQQ